MHDDAVSGVRELVAAAVGLCGQLPAGAAGGTGTSARTDSKGVLRESGGVSWLLCIVNTCVQAHDTESRRVRLTLV